MTSEYARCKCGCDGKVFFLISGTDFGGQDFVDEPVCHTAARYLVESAQELGLPVEVKELYPDAFPYTDVMGNKVPGVVKNER